MRTTVKISALFLFMAIIGLSSCKKDNPQEPTPNPEEKTMEDLQIPSDFDFSTTTTLFVHITDVENGAKYDIYSLKSQTPDDYIYSDEDTSTMALMDDLNKKVASGMTVNNQLDIKVVIPSYHKFIYIVRSKEGYFTRELIPVDVTSSDINYSYDGYHNQGGFKSASATAGNDDIIYSVNAYNTNLYSINLTTGDVNVVTQIPFKSIACAVDRDNGRIYIANRNRSYELGYYDLNSNNFVIVGNLAGSFPRMDYNPADGLLYTSSTNYINTIDPTNATYLQTYPIHGIDTKSWGDLAFAEDGTMYILTKVGVYLCTFSGNVVNATLITDHTFPTSLTSLAVGSNNHLYMSNQGNGKLIELDPATGSWSYFPISQNIKINDFGIVRTNNSGGNDSDGDGVIDIQDDYPDDPDRAFNNYFPDENLWASLAFEDLWPSKGDYDFNDMVIGYNVNQVTSASNKVVDIISKFQARHNGAGLHNAFAFQIPVDQTSVGSVTSTYTPTGQISLNGNGTISGQNLANILVFEDNWDVTGSQIDITIHFSTPQDVTLVGTPPYNPYLIKDGDQAVEVHLPDMEPTALADATYFGTADDTSDPATGRYYKSDKNLPWAINIVYDFKWMKEKQEIINGYLHFADWAESGGTLYPDWYKDLPGYRDDTFLDDDGQ